MTATETQNTCRWLARPVPRENGWHRAALAIGDTAYRAECHLHTDDAGRTYQCVDLQPDGQLTLRVIFDPAGNACCECSHRGECAHVRGVRAALDWLVCVERSREEYDRVRNENNVGFPVGGAA